MDNPAARTALGPVAMVAAHQHINAAQRIADDPLARSFLPASVRPLIWMARWAPVRNWLINTAESSVPGLWAGMLCRRRYLDDLLRASAAGREAVVLLGAGFDTRPYRLPELADLPIFEVDLAVNSAAKRARLEALYGSVPANVRLIPLDFQRDDLKTALTKHGFQWGWRTGFIWEAVTQYLTEAEVHRALATLAGAASGSVLGFTYVLDDFISGRKLYGADKGFEQFRGMPPLWKFGVQPETVGALLEPYGWQVVEDMGCAEFTERYARPTGTTLPVYEIERTVQAAKR